MQLSTTSFLYTLTQILKLRYNNSKIIASLILYIVIMLSEKQ